MIASCVPARPSCRPRCTDASAGLARRRLRAAEHSAQHAGCRRRRTRRRATIHGIVEHHQHHADHDPCRVAARASPRPRSGRRPQARRRPPVPSATSAPAAAGRLRYRAVRSSCETIPGIASVDAADCGRSPQPSATSRPASARPRQHRDRRQPDGVVELDDGATDRSRRAGLVEVVRPAGRQSPVGDHRDDKRRHVYEPREPQLPRSTSIAATDHKARHRPGDGELARASASRRSRCARASTSANRCSWNESVSPGQSTRATA